MKKNLLFGLIGGVILFIWQFISFAMPNLHESGMRYTPLQDEILQAIRDSGLEEGMYMIGQPDPATYGTPAYDEDMKKYEGQSWGILNYQMNQSMAMGMNMVRGFLVCFVIAWMLFWMIRQLKDQTIMNAIWLSLGVGLIGFLFVPYTGFIWFKEPDIWAYFIDGIVPWVVLGIVGHKMA